MTKKILLVIAAFFITILLIVDLVHDLGFLIERKKAVATVLSWTVPNSMYPKTFLVKMRFWNQYVNDSTVRNLSYQTDENGPPKCINVYYSKSTPMLFAIEKKRTTWFSFVWKSIAATLLLLYVGITIRELSRKQYNL